MAHPHCCRALQSTFLPGAPELPAVPFSNAPSQADLLQSTEFLKKQSCGASNIVGCRLCNNRCSCCHCYSCSGCLANTASLSSCWWCYNCIASACFGGNNCRVMMTWTAETRDVAIITLLIWYGTESVLEFIVSCWGAFASLTAIVSVVSPHLKQSYESPQSSTSSLAWNSLTESQQIPIPLLNSIVACCFFHCGNDARQKHVKHHLCLNRCTNGQRRVIWLDEHGLHKRWTAK